MIEGYVFDKKYVKIESYLNKNFTNGMTKKQLKNLITKYQQKNSLSAKVRTFVNKGPYLDQLYFSACFENDNQIKKLEKGGSLNMLILIIKKQLLLYQQQFNVKQANQKVKILEELQNFLKNRTNKVHLSTLHNHFKSMKTDNKLFNSMNVIANQLYDVRSKFLHTNKKKKPI